MLTKPECGWTYFQIDGEHKYIMGYLTDVAIDWLEQAIHGLKELSPFTVRGFSEPGRVLCTVSYWNCYVIEEEEHKMHKIWSFHDAPLSMIDFCKRLYRDISKDIDAWVMWDTSSMENLYCVHE